MLAQFSGIRPIGRPDKWTASWSHVMVAKIGHSTFQKVTPTLQMTVSLSSTSTPRDDQLCIRPTAINAYLLF